MDVRDPHDHRRRVRGVPALARAVVQRLRHRRRTWSRERLVLELDRWHAAFDDGRIVGGAAAASYRFTVPGGVQVSGAGVTAVGVQPTHRRRGINAALMRAQLDDVHARGEPIAVLYASEGGIYGRFGYGLSAFLGEIDFEGGRSTFIRGYRPVGQRAAASPERGVAGDARDLRSRAAAPPGHDRHGRRVVGVAVLREGVREGRAHVLRGPRDRWRTRRVRDVSRQARVAGLHPQARAHGHGSWSRPRRTRTRTSGDTCSTWTWCIG